MVVHILHFGILFHPPQSFTSIQSHMLIMTINLFSMPLPILKSPSISNSLQPLLGIKINSSVGASYLSLLFILIPRLQNFLGEKFPSYHETNN